MKSYEIDGIARQRSVTTEDDDLSRFESVIQRSYGEPQCFYCNFSLECGQQKCIWCEDCD